MARCEDCIHNKVCNEWAVTSGIPFVNANTCENFMTANVAPKSEVEELIREYKSLAKTVNEASELIRKLKGKVEKAKVEVSKEIFEEIDKSVYEYLNKNYAERYFYLLETIEELKKKYTGKL